MRGQFQDQGGFFSYIGADSGGSSANEHFSVDGTLIEAWASHKSFQPKDGSDDGDGSNFHGQRRKNDTHQSTSDPQAKLYRKAAGAKPSSAIWAMRSWRTATVLLLTAPSHRPAASPSGVPLRRCSRRKPNDRDEESRSARTKPTTPAITLRRCAR